MENEHNVGILLESGTNEMEIMEFTIAGETFGINVAKVREILMPYEVKHMPHAHPTVEGVFKPRDKVITVIDLPLYLNLPPAGEGERNLFIITYFNKMDVAFRVHTVEGIHRISWNDIQKPDKTIYGGADGVATGIAKYHDRLITILDFEKIVADIAPSTSIQINEIEAMGDRERRDCHIVVAEDSMLLSKLIQESLHKAGYLNVSDFNNGREAFDYIQQFGDDPAVIDKIACIITDIEMPVMDGHRLTKLVKDHPTLKQIPVIIFSSLIDEEMRIKGESIGADAQLSKPEIGNLVKTIDKLVDINDRDAE